MNLRNCLTTVLFLREFFHALLLLLPPCFPEKCSKMSFFSLLTRECHLCCVRLVVPAAQIGLVKLRQKKAHICEIQVNGGDVAAKVDFARGLFEQKVPVDAVFAKVRQADESRT